MTTADRLASAHARLRSPMFRLVMRRHALTGSPEDVSRAAYDYMREAGEDMTGLYVEVVPHARRGEFTFNVKAVV